MLSENDVSYAEGNFFFVRGATLYAQPVDASGFTPNGEPKPIANVPISSGRRYTVAHDTLVYLPEGSDVRTELVHVDRNGKLLAALGQPAFYFAPRLSHDASRIAIAQGAPASDIWIVEVEGGRTMRLTFAPENEAAPVWSPDDREVAYHRQEHATKRVIMRQAVAAGTPQRVFETAAIATPVIGRAMGSGLLRSRTSRPMPRTN
jgi:Tol biopolymer transport system component